MIKGRLKKKVKGGEGGNRCNRMSVGKDSEEVGGEEVVAEEGEEEACTEQIKARNVENIVYVLSS